MQKIYYLTYVSRLSFMAGIMPRTLADIHNISNLHNPAYHVTGFLCFGNGYFFQYIEGPEEAIVQLFNNLKRDKRHHQVTLVSEGVQTQRLFAQWRMLVVNLNHASTPEALVDALQPLFSANPEPQQAATVVNLMQSYQGYGLSHLEQAAQKNTSYYKISLLSLIKTHQSFLLVQAILIGLILLSVGQLIWVQ